MFGVFFQPIAHLAFDDARVDTITAFGDDFLGNFLEQIPPPSLPGRRALGATPTRCRASQKVERPGTSPFFQGTSQRSIWR